MANVKTVQQRTIILMGTYNRETPDPQNNPSFEFQVLKADLEKLRARVEALEEPKAPEAPKVGDLGYFWDGDGEDFEIGELTHIYEKERIRPYAAWLDYETRATFINFSKTKPC